LEAWVGNNPDDAKAMAMLNQIKSADFEFMEKPE